MSITLKGSGASGGLKIKLVALATAVTLSGVAALVPLVAVADHTTAHTIEQLTAQIAVLQAQLAALAGAPAAAPAGACTFTKSLTVGSRGDDVKCLQDYLTGTGHFTYSGGSTGYFGPITRSAVAAWQAANGVAPAVGYFGPISRAKYDSLMAAAPVTPVTPVTPETPVTPAVGTGLTVTAAIDQPAAALAPLAASRVPFTKAVFTASADGDITVKTVTVERQGLMDDDALDSVLLLDEEGYQLGLSKTLTSAHRAVLNEAFVVKAGTSRTMTVAANMVSTSGTNAGQVGKLAVVAVDAGTATVNATFPIVGNGMTINETLTLGSLTSPTRGALDPGSGRSSLEIGTVNFTASAGQWSVGSAEKVLLEQVRWYQSGSAASGDMKNIKVRVKDTDYDAAVSSDGKYYTAKFSPAVEFDKGATLQVLIKLDVESGSDRTIDFDIQKRTDVVVKGQTYGYYIIPANGTSDPTDDTGAFASNEPYYDAFQHTISKGTLRVEKSNAVLASNVGVQISDVELGAFNLEAKGEPIQISSFKLMFSLSAGEDGTQIDNVTIVDKNGVVVAGPRDVLSDETVTFTETWAVPVGLQTYKIKGKLTTDFENDDTIIASVDPDGDITAKGEKTGLSITPSPTSSTTANTITVKRGSLKVTLASSPAAQNVVRGVNGYLFSKVQYDATDSGEDIRITSQELTINTGAGAIGNDLNTCQMFDGATALNTGSNIVNPSGTDSDAVDEDAEDTYTFDPHLIVSKGTVKNIDVKCNISSSAVGGNDANDWYWIGLSDHDASTTATADSAVTSKDTGNSITESVTAIAGPTMTVKTGGALSIALDSSSPSDRYGIAGKTDVLMSVFKLHADYEAIDLRRIGFQIGSSTASTSDILKLTLWDGATNVGMAVVVTSNTTDSLATSTLSSSFIVPKDGDKVLTVKADLAALGVAEPATRGHLVAVDYNGQDTNTTYGVGQSSGTTLNPAASVDSAAGGVRLVKSYPTLERMSVPSNTLANGEMTLYRFKVTADAAGSVGIAKMSFRVSSTTVATTSVFKLYGYSDSSFSVAAYSGRSPIHSRNIDIVGETTWNGVATQTAAGVWPIVFFFDPVVYASPTAGVRDREAIQVPAGESRYFELKGTVASSAAGDSISVAMLGDDEVANNTNLVNRQNADDVQDDALDSNFVWSPNTTSTSATTSDDWLNGYLLQGLPSTEMSQQTFSK